MVQTRPSVGALPLPAAADAAVEQPWPPPIRSPVMSTEIDAIRTAIVEGATADIGALPLPEAVRGALVRADEQEMFAGLPVGAEGSPEVDPRRGVPAPRAGTRRGVRGGDGQLDQLQHGVDVDLRAPADLRVPEATGPGERVGRAPRPAVPRDGQRRLGCRAAHRFRGAQLEGRRQGHRALQLRRRPGPVARTTTR